MAREATTKEELLQAHSTYLHNLLELVRVSGEYRLVRTIGAYIHYALVRFWKSYQEVP